MSRITTFVAIGIVVVVAIYSRRLAIDLLGPGSTMWILVADVQFAGINGEDWAMRVYEAVAVWVPWLLVAAAILGGLFREFAQTNVTRARR